jgi:sugar lactone lactonase YvrE
MPRSHGCFWNEEDGTISVAETFEGHIFRLHPKDGEVMDVFQITGIEVHGLTKSADGRIWVGDAATNLVSVVEP